jgi:hypothetical protein
VLHVGEVIDPRLVELLQVDVAEDAQQQLVPTSFSRILEGLLGAVEEVVGELLRRRIS